MERQPRIKILHKWVQGNQLVLRTLLRYGNETKRVTMSCPLEMARNKAQFRAFLEEAYEANRPQQIDLSDIPEEIE